MHLFIKKIVCKTATMSIMWPMSHDLHSLNQWHNDVTPKQYYVFRSHWKEEKKEMTLRRHITQLNCTLKDLWNMFILRWMNFNSVLIQSFPSLSCSNTFPFQQQKYSHLIKCLLIPGELGNSIYRKLFFHYAARSFVGKRLQKIVLNQFVMARYLLILHLLLKYFSGSKTRSWLTTF